MTNSRKKHIQLFLLNDRSKSIEETLYRYSQQRVNDVRFKWTLVSAFVLSVLLGVIEGDRRYAVQFEIHQKVFRDRAHKKVAGMVEDMKQMQYNKEMGVR